MYTATFIRYKNDLGKMDDEFILCETNASACFNFSENEIPLFWILLREKKKRGL